MSPTAKRIARPDGLVLAGGEGQRVGGRDKGLLRFRGHTAAESAIDVLKRHCDSVFVSANRNLDAYGAMQTQGVIRDLRPGHAGPLAGLEALRSRGTQETLLILPCDMPAVAAGVHQRLLDVLGEEPDIDVCYARSARGNHYLVAAARRSALQPIPRLLDAGQNAVRAWLKSVRSESVGFEGSLGESLGDMNTPADWDA